MPSHSRFFFGVLLALGMARSGLAASSHAHFLALDAGLFSNNVVGRANALDEDRSVVSHYSIYARLRRGFHIGKNFFLEPALSALIPWYSGVDGNSKLFTFHTDLPILIPVFSWLRFRAGPGLEWQWIVTSASTIDLSNGTGTSEFYVPGGTRTVILATVQLGLEFRISKKICANADVTVLSIASSTRRSFQAALGLGIYL